VIRHNVVQQQWCDQISTDHTELMPALGNPKKRQLHKPTNVALFHGGHDMAHALDERRVSPQGARRAERTEMDGLFP
jgi:hypothetical protein